MLKNTMKLGSNILVVLDATQESMMMVRALANQLPGAAYRHVTLVRYCPPGYWEHGGTSESVVTDSEQVRRRKTAAMESANCCFREAREILENAGIPAAHIYTRTCTEGINFVNAILKESNRQVYSTVAVHHRHTNLIKQLRGEDFWSNLRRSRPQNVWVYQPEQTPAPAPLRFATA